MKTINYQLSSQKCLEEGWTVRPPSPLTADEGDDAFIPEPLNIDLIRSGRVRIGAEIYCGLHMPVWNACVKLWNYKNENTEILLECRIVHSCIKMNICKECFSRFYKNLLYSIANGILFWGWKWKCLYTYLPFFLAGIGGEVLWKWTEVPDYVPRWNRKYIVSFSLHELFCHLACCWKF